MPIIAAYGVDPDSSAAPGGEIVIPKVEWSGTPLREAIAELPVHGVSGPVDVRRELTQEPPYPVGVDPERGVLEQGRDGVRSGAAKLGDTFRPGRIVGLTQGPKVEPCQRGDGRIGRCQPLQARERVGDHGAHRPDGDGATAGSVGWMTGDGLAAGEGSGDSGVSNRVFAQIAQFMGDTELRGRVIWFLLTCRPDLLPVDAILGTLLLILGAVPVLSLYLLKLVIDAVSARLAGSAAGEGEIVRLILLAGGVAVLAAVRVYYARQHPGRLTT